MSAYEHQMCEEWALNSICKSYRSNPEEGEKFLPGLVRYIKDRTLGTDTLGNMHLIKTYIVPGNKSKIEKRLHLDELYPLLADLSWIQVHPTRDYTLAEIKAMAEEAKGIEKVDIQHTLSILNHLEDDIELEIGRRWGRIEDV